MKNITTYTIALVWFVNGLYCKILNQVPRHQEIVDEIMSFQVSREITLTIGVLEVLLAIWLLCNIRSKLNAIVQIASIIAMNIIEFIYVPHLLLWGRLNIVFALLFAAFIYVNAFHYKTLLKNKYHATNT
ncbi:hypothetical protein MHTCC0001_34530 [Flavobacteriaceae bacterium MHTCC 0001]